MFIKLYTQERGDMVLVNPRAVAWVVASNSGSLLVFSGDSLTGPALAVQENPERIADLAAQAVAKW